MANPSNIVVPVALNERQGADFCSPWFIDFTPDGPSEYHPRAASYKPLVNGLEAFGALYDAIDQATCSIDYICWGFQPSMYFRRDGKSLRLGELLIKKATQDHVKVRILCWLDKAHLAQIGEPSMPMYDVTRPLSQNEDKDQRAYDWSWYFRARMPASSPTQLARGASARKIASQFHTNGASNRPSLVAEPLRDIGIELVTRDFSWNDREEIRDRENLERQLGSGPSWMAANVAYTAEPSHHQKMVLIDYEIPKVAVGFVMGHNTLDAYWDDDAHSCVKKAPNRGRNGATPRQDMSAMVTGPILEHLNVNFCRAWHRDAKEDLLAKRKGLESLLKPRQGFGMPVMAQINRTQSQEGVRNIRSLYLQTVNNATQFIYIENQYFRWPLLAEKIKDAVNAQIKGGRDPAKPVYLFVVTNSDDDALDKGQGTTYDMLNSLGQARQMPKVYRLERQDALATQNDAVVRNILQAKPGAQTRDALMDIDSVNQQKAKLREMKDEDIPIPEIPGLRTLVCTLVAPDSPAGHWMPVYVHSKIMIIDDVFLTHGSANVNRRSMEVDSELNICHERMDVTQPLRRHLWNIHTNGQGAQDDPAVAFAAWSYILKTNESRQGAKNTSPYASLIGFKSTTTKRMRMD
ncbi:phospholipase D-like domain-containing protein [Paraburkholderia sp. RL17-368-BIF-A]|jgi:phosphatidylserine/phosphatidylglycerophosphate/cardiolipin synthase-like enzyme|uniref:phospholipase D-like domain-containing protein n=1 Tax=Paraburkholderia sp. RL17-368-BIF-A TaxID=3031628 RepID=UPI0006BD23AB|nr:phospholipase [Burkholderia sp. HB1]